ncbi:MAG: hypothetical protein LUG50_05905 [Planctomycetaceae bacterium]|nr:hypothetical protein [Planctomycetaceae bacterium]
MEETREQRIQKWKLLVQERLDRGISVRTFCQEKGYTEDMYYHWVNVIHKTDPSFVTRRTSRSYAAQATNPLVEIHPGRLPGDTINHPAAAEGPEAFPVATIQSGSVRIDFFQNAEAGFIRQVLEAVRYD